MRTLYRFIDEGQLPAYKMGRVIRLQAGDVDAFIERARIVPGTLEHLYPEARATQPGRGPHGGDDMAAHETAAEGPPGANGDGARLEDSEVEDQR